MKGFRENYAVYTPNSRSLQEAREEKIFGQVPEEKQAELYDMIRNQRPLGKCLVRFLKENGLLFAGTDRNVLNLPAIGKSMTFHTIGLTSEESGFLSSITTGAVGIARLSIKWVRSISWRINPWPLTLGN